MSLARLRKRFITVLIVLAALLLLMVNILLIWVVTGPRSLNAITPYIESALAPNGSTYKVKIEDSELIWDGWQHPIGIHVKNVEVVDSKGVVIAHFPEIGIRLYFLQLLQGRVDLKSLEVLHPTALLVQNDDGSFSFGFGKSDDTADKSLSDALLMLTDGEGEQPITHLKSLIIKHATLSIKKSKEGVFLQSEDASLEIERKNGSAKGTLTMPLLFGQKRGELDAEISLNRDTKTFVAETVYSDIPSDILHSLFPTQEWMKQIQMPISGWAKVTSDFDAHISGIDFMTEAGPGVVTYASEFPEPLHIQRIHVEGGLSDKLTALKVSKGLVDFKSFTINFNGAFNKVGEEYAIDSHVDIGSLPTDNMALYWPMSLSPRTRAWVLSHISGGTLVKQEVGLHFKPGELKLKDTPEQAIDARVEIKNATVKYLPKHPAVTNIDAVIKFTGKSMDAHISHAKDLTATEVTSAHLQFPDLNAPDVRLFVDMDLNAPAKDVQQFLSLPDLDKAKKMNLTKDISGRASGNAKLDFIAFSEDDSKESGHINYNIQANLDGVSQAGFLGKYDVSNAVMKVGVDNKGINAHGKAVVNQLPMNIDLKSQFGRANETTYAIKTNMPLTRLPEFGLPKLEFAKGSMGVDASFVSSDTMDKAEANLDLQNTSITLPQHGFNKKAGEKGMLNLSVEQLPGGDTAIRSFTLKGDNFAAAGEGIIDKKTDDFSSLTLSQLRFGNQNLDYLAYVDAPGSIKLQAKGRSFDLTPYIGGTKNRNFGRNYDINIKTDRLIFGQNRQLNDASIVAECGKECRQVNATAKLADGSAFTYVISNDNLMATCSNAGQLFETLGLTNSIKGGRLQIKGIYNGNKLEGVAEMSDYSLHNAPILTKIITIASLTGIFNTVTGNGIAFEKLTAPFAYEHGVIVLKDAKTHGSALGITTDGVVDMEKSKLNLHGTLVPSYTMNSMAGNIPLIGDLLTGGKGKGIIAINYTISGEMNDPSVTINPLSAFTPGFLRGVFNIFDKPAPDLDSIEADRKKADDKKKEENKLTAPVNLNEKPSGASPTALSPPPVAAPSN